MDSVVLVVCVVGCCSFTVVQEQSVMMPLMPARLMMIFVIFDAFIWRTLLRLSFAWMAVVP